MFNLNSAKVSQVATPGEKQPEYKGARATELRRIQPISVVGLDTAAPDDGEPICERVDPASLFVDPSYQRDIGERGLRQIRKIVEAWAWSKFKPPICAYAEHDGVSVLKVLDGQHTAIAAASHPDIDMIPVMIVDAADTASQAEAFVGQNTQRLGVTMLQLHRAGLVAGDDDAVTMEQVCNRASVLILDNPPARGQYRPRETVAIKAVRDLIDRRGAMKARMILEVLANADLAPITANHIRAAELLMTDAEYCEGFDAADLTTEIVTAGKSAENEAKVFSVAHKVPVWRALAVQWFRKVKKRRQPAKVAA